MTFDQELIKLMPILRPFAKKLVNGHDDRADDLIQDSMLLALRFRNSFKEGTNMKAWLYTIVRNAAFSRYRKKQPIHDPDSFYANTMAVKPTQGVGIVWEEFLDIYKKLPEDQKEAIQLIVVNGLSYEEAAEVAKVRPGTMKSRVSRARSYLNKHYDLDMEDSIFDGVVISNDNFRNGDYRFRQSGWNPATESTATVS